MGKKKLKALGHWVPEPDTPERKPSIALTFNRPLTPLEAAGILQIVREALDNGS